MATAGYGDGWRGGDRGRGHGWPGGDRGRGHGGRGGDRERGHGGRGDDRALPPTGHAAASNASSGVPQMATPSRRPPTGHAPAGNAVGGVQQVGTASRLPSEGPGATSVVQTESPKPRHRTDCDAYHDVDIENLKKYVHELEIKNDELKQKLEAAQTQLKELNEGDEEIRKCHDVFLCPNESDYKKLEEFLADPQSKLTMDIKVHGVEVIQALKQPEDLPIFVPKAVRNGRNEPKKLRRMTTVAKYVILGIFEDIYRLHRHGWSLNGKFTIQNFYWTHLKKIKFDPALKLVVCKRGRDEMINDFHQIYQIILKMLSFHDSGLPIPDDLQSILDLLNSDDPVRHHEIIRYNMSLLSEIGKKGHFITLYDRLQQQICEDDKKGPGEEKKSEKVLKFISTHFSSPVDGKEPWSNMAKNNSYVGAVYELCSAHKGMVLEEPLDLLIVWHNALTHILESAVEDGVSLFKDEDLVNMLESAIPGVFNGLQRAMSEVGLLELPHLMRAMRM